VLDGDFSYKLELLGCPQVRDVGLKVHQSSFDDDYPCNYSNDLVVFKF